MGEQWYRFLYPEWDDLPYWQHNRNAHREDQHLLELARQEAREALAEDEADAAEDAQAQPPLLHLSDVDSGWGCCAAEQVGR